MAFKLSSKTFLTGALCNVGQARSTLESRKSSGYCTTTRTVKLCAASFGNTGVRYGPKGFAPNKRLCAKRFEARAEIQGIKWIRKEGSRQVLGAQSNVGANGARDSTINGNTFGENIRSLSGNGDQLDVNAVLKTLSILQSREESLRDQTDEVFQLLTAAARAISARTEGANNQEANSTNINSRQPTVEEQFNNQVNEYADTEEESECLVHHPGAICCTKRAISKDESNRRAVITLQTSTQCTENASQMDMDDFVALASRALLAQAQTLNQQTTEAVNSKTINDQGVHSDLLEILQKGEIIAAQPNEVVSKFNHPSYKVTLRYNGREVDAIFKPSVEGDGEGWHRPSIEWVAYTLNRMLGMDYVPPVAYRVGGVDVDYQRYEEGAFILFVNDVKELREAESGRRGVPLEQLLSDTRILDVLLHNSDRHHGHILIGDHWCIKNMEGGTIRRPVLIDHAAGFREEAYVTMEHENAFQTGPVRTVAARTYLRLRFLDAKKVAEMFSGVLSEREMRGLVHRRNVILKYLDEMVEDCGYNTIVREF